MNNKLSKCLALIVVAGALAFAGCGSSSDNGPSAKDAQTQYKPIDTSIGSLGDQLGTSIANASSATDVQIGTQFDTLATSARHQVANLKKLDVPSDLTAKRDALADALSTGVDDLETIAAAAKSHDAASAETATRKLLVDSKEIKQSRTELNAAIKKAVND
jgi:hypothetical protein